MNQPIAPTAEALAAARERLCRRCKSWQRPYRIQGAFEKCHCFYSQVKEPLTSVGKDCPYFRKETPCGIT